MAKTSERIARVEEGFSRSEKETEKRVEKCMKTFDDIHLKLEVVNREQGETNEAIKNLGSQLTGLINQKVSAPISGKDRAILYGAAITAFFTFLGVVVPAIINVLTPH